jgi:hypothetical protein
VLAPSGAIPDHDLGGIDNNSEIPRIVAIGQLSKSIEDVYELLISRRIRGGKRSFGSKNLNSHYLSVVSPPRHRH